MHRAVPPLPTALHLHQGQVRTWPGLMGSAHKPQLGSCSQAPGAVRGGSPTPSCTGHAGATSSCHGQGVGGRHWQRFCGGGWHHALG